MPELLDAPPAAVSRMSIWVLWVVRGILAMLFVYVGAVKLPGDPRSMWVNLFSEIGLGQWFRYFTAVVEIAGGLLLLVPAATPAAVFLLASAMVGALVVHVLFVGVGPPSVVVCVLLAAILTIG